MAKKSIFQGVTIPLCKEQVEAPATQIPGLLAEGQQYLNNSAHTNIGDLLKEKVSYVGIGECANTIVDRLSLLRNAYVENNAAFTTFEQNFLELQDMLAKLRLNSGVDSMDDQVVAWNQPDGSSGTPSTLVGFVINLESTISNNTFTPADVDMEVAGIQMVAGIDGKINQ
ncbi:hypothetical protein VCHA38O209_50266 [Vibrio chagasii]|nr:hypothetical protein VCHA38O209_50266 [Vibrio chagasii]